MNKSALMITKHDHIQGNPDSPVTLLEYGDYECPYCGRAYIVLEKLKRDAGDMFRFVFRNFPLSQIHPHALHAAYAGEAAGHQRKFWEMHDQLFEHQDMLEDENFLNYAEVLGLNLEQFVVDMGSERVREKVSNDFLSGIRSGVNGTPTFFINGVRHDGAASYDQLLDAVIAASPRGKTP